MGPTYTERQVRVLFKHYISSNKELYVILILQLVVAYLIKY